MSFLSPDNFALALFSLIKIGKDARNAYLDDKLLKNAAAKELGLHAFGTLSRVSGSNVSASNIDALMTSDQNLRAWAATAALEKNILTGDPDYYGVVMLAGEKEDRLVFENGKVQVLDEPRFLSLFRYLLVKARDVSEAQEARDKNLIELQQAEWLSAFKEQGGKPLSPWHRFAHSVLDYSLDIVAERPEILGGGRKFRQIVASVVPSIATAYNPNDPQKSRFADHLPTVFTKAALNILIEKPELVSSEPRWQRLVTGVLTPLQMEVEKHGEIRALAAEDRLRDLMLGTLAPAAIRIVSENSNDYFKGGASGDRLAGIVLRATLGEYASSEPGARDLRKFFGSDGIERIVFHALDAAQKRPELFIRDNKRSTFDDTLRKLLPEVAELFKSKDGRVNSLDGALATDLFCLGLDSIATYMIGRIKPAADSSLQRQLGAELATFLIRDIVAGIKSAATDPNQGNGLAILSARLGQEKVGEIFKIIADYASRSPNVFLGKDQNPFVVSVAKLLAGAILEDKDGLLTTDEWKSVALASAEAALENPNTLFGKFFDGPDEDVVARRLIHLLLHKAKENFDKQKNTTGQILFGKVLEEAIIATLDAASTGILNVLAEKAKVEERLEAIEKLIDRLNDLAKEKDPSLIIGSRDWIRIYRLHVTNVMHRGSEALRELSDTVLLQSIRREIGALVHEEGEG